MKPIHYLLLLCQHFVLYPTISHAQTKIGLHTGAHICHIDFDIAEPYTGYYAGLNTRLPLTEKWAISTHLNYAKKGWGFGRVEPLDEEGKMHHQYLDLQIAGAYSLTPSLSLLAGMEAGRLLKTRREPTEVFFEDLYQKGNFGLLLGVGYAVVKSLRIEAKYVHGLSYLVREYQTDVDGNSLGEVKSGRFRIFQIGLSSDIITLRKKEKA